MKYKEKLKAVKRIADLIYNVQTELDKYTHLMCPDELKVFFKDKQHINNYMIIGSYNPNIFTTKFNLPELIDEMKLTYKNSKQSFKNIKDKMFEGDVITVESQLKLIKTELKVLKPKVSVSNNVVSFSLFSYEIIK